MSLSFVIRMVMMKKRMKAIRSTVLKARLFFRMGCPSVCFGATDQGSRYASAAHSQGKPRAMLMLKMLLPKAFAIAMSPCPFLATMLLANRFGSEVPAAPTVSPTTLLDTPMICPARSPEYVMT